MKVDLLKAKKHFLKNVMVRGIKNTYAFTTIKILQDRSVI